MRILLVSWEYPPVIEGGLGRHVAKLSLALSAAGHEVHVLTRGGDAGVEPQRFAGVHVHRVAIPPFSRDVALLMSWVDELNGLLAARGQELLAANDFDVVHSHDWMVAGAARELAQSAHAPWLVTVHATEFGRHGGWVHTHPQYEIHWTERAMVRDASHVVCCSEYMAGHVRRVFGVQETHVSTIPNGIDPADLAPPSSTDLVALRRSYADDDESLVVMVGRLVHEKGFHVALDALASLAGREPRVRWAIAGTGTAEPRLHDQAAALRLTGSGRFLGRVDDDELHALYRVADVAVVPSLYEPFGIVPLEAMAAGCPVVVSDTGGLREVVAGTDAVVRVPAGDATALARGLDLVLSDPARRAAMRRAGLTHSARFDWTAVAGQTEGVYAELISMHEPLGV